MDRKDIVRLIRETSVRFEDALQAARKAYEDLEAVADPELYAILDKPWTVTLTQDVSGDPPYWIARTKEFGEGVIGTGDTYDAALKDLRAALKAVINVMLERGDPIPESEFPDNCTLTRNIRLEWGHRIRFER